MTGARNGKPSRTCWRVIEIKDARTLVEFMPETGRTHQIRVHAAEGLGVPVAGDPVYGRGGGPFLLHAAHLVVTREGKPPRSEEHTSELQSLMRNSYAVFR